MVWHLGNQVKVKSRSRNGYGDSALLDADHAMYAAKQAGDNQFCFFTQRMQQTVSARVSLLGNRRQALLEQQLEVFYQPIVDLSDDQIVKAEALLRWHHPEKGLLLPREFIRFAEKEGLIHLRFGPTVETFNLGIGMKINILDVATLTIQLKLDPFLIKSNFQRKMKARYGFHS